MRAVCSTETFGKKLALVSRGVSARSTIQLLGGILLEGGGEGLKLSATDMEISIQTNSKSYPQGTFRYGRNELSIQHFHANLLARLGTVNDARQV